MVFISLGASSPKMEMDELMRRYELRTDKNPELTIVNACMGGHTVEKIVTLWGDYEPFIDSQLKASNVSASEVTFVWLKTDSLKQTMDSNYEQYLETYMVRALDLINEKFPTALILLTGRHDGFSEKHAAPRALHNDNVCQRLPQIRNFCVYAASFFQQSIDGEWDKTCVDNSGVHPNEKGLKVAVDLLEGWLEKTTWFTNKVIDPPVPVDEGIYIEPDVAHHNVGFHHGPHAHDFDYTEQDYLDFESLAGGKGATLPLRTRVLSKGEGSLGINQEAIARFLVFLNEMKARGIRIQVVTCLYEALTLEEVKPHIDAMLSAGMENIAFEIGNECFSVYDTFDAYLEVCSKLVEDLKNAYPGVPIIFPVGGRPYDSDGDGAQGSDDINTNRGQGTKHSNWNNALAKWIKAQPEWFGIAPHIYPNQREFVTSPNIPMGQVVIEGELNQGLETFFNEFVRDIPNALSYYEKILTYHTNLFGRKLYVTEFGSPQAELRNTIAFSNYLWQAITAFSDRADYWFFHSGISAAESGSKNPSKRADTIKGNISRQEWLTIQLFRTANREVVGQPISGQVTDKLLGYMGLNYEGQGYSLFMAEGSKPGYLQLTNGEAKGEGYGFAIKEVIDPPTTDEYVPVEVMVWEGQTIDTEEEVEIEYVVNGEINLTTNDTVLEHSEPVSFIRAMKKVKVPSTEKVLVKKTYFEKK